MIHHVSISAENPLHVAEVLAEVCQGKCAPFPPHPGSYMVLTMDPHGTMIEVYPSGTELIPGYGQEPVNFAENPFASAYGAIHLALSVPSSQETIEQIADREGWRAVRCDRDGFFEVIEFWVENTLMVELLPPAIAPKYVNFMQPENLEKLFAAMQAEAVAV